MSSNLASAMTDAARNGYINGTTESGAYRTSEIDMAWRTGLWLHRRGYNRPDSVRMSRGYKVRARIGTREILLDFGNDYDQPQEVKP